VRRLRVLAPRAVFVNCYGATETPQIAACFRIHEDGDDRMRVPVGRGIADTRLWLRNAEGKAAHPGERAEILVCAPYLSSGYLNDPALTARRFIDSPAAAGEQYGRAYRTGDLGIRDGAGNVTCVGRADNQVKIRGFRIELEEIETALQSIDGVRKAAVVVRETSGLDRQLVAWIEGRELSGSAIRESLRLLLPAHMIPARFVTVEALPLNASGKIDRAMLSENAADLEKSATGNPPETEAERVLASVWTRLLDVSSVVREDSFFDLGGDSLSAVELLIAVQNAFGVRLSPDDILRKPTLAGLGAEVDARASRGPALELQQDVQVVSLATGGSRQPVYWIPGGGGLSVVAFRRISRLLDAGRPVNGLVSSPESALRGIDLRERAAQYVEALVRWQPEGPYHLFGYSFGSWLAYEMARQLSAAGRSVGLVAVFDTEVARGLSAVEWAQAVSRTAARHGARLLRLPRTARGEYIRTNIKPSYWNLRRRVRQMRDGGRGLGDAFEAADRLNRQVTRAYARSAPGGYPGRILAILAESSLWSVLSHDLDPRGRWDRLATGGCEIRYAPGSHLSMIEPPHVERLAAVLRDALQPHP
jgi:thioesterase domain-containing protein/acyl carrier protein